MLVVAFVGYAVFRMVCGILYAPKRLTPTCACCGDRETVSIVPSWTPLLGLFFIGLAVPASVYLPNLLEDWLNVERPLALTLNIASDVVFGLVIIFSPLYFRKPCPECAERKRIIRHMLEKKRQDASVS